MKSTVHHPGYGTIEYEESFWLGKKTITQNGRVLEKRGKDEYLLSDGEREQGAVLKGNVLLGIRLEMQDGEHIALTPALRWYEIVFAVVILAFMLVWGNSVKLCSIIPVVGGAVGGGVTGVGVALGLLFAKKAERTSFRMLAWLGVFAATFLVCTLIGLLLLLAAL